ncbi:MoaD/ThiS family protein [Chloroflexota bacterium]
MSITVTIAAAIMEEVTRSTDKVEVSGVSTFQDILDKLEVMFPGFNELMYNDNGRLNAILDVYINGESVYPDERVAKVKDGDVVSITMLYEGG